jgi:hypothetical protein
LSVPLRAGFDHATDLRSRGPGRYLVADRHDARRSVGRCWPPPRVCAGSRAGHGVRRPNALRSRGAVDRLEIRRSRACALVCGGGDRGFEAAEVKGSRLISLSGRR